MWIGCFDGDVRLDAEGEGDSSVETLVDRFVAHVRATHDVAYPDDELRIWARNFAEASVRADGPVGRRPSIGTIDVHPVSADRIDDWLRLFDRDAFPDNPDWGSCYCLHPHSGDGPERPWRAVRAEMVERLRSGATRGYLAYVDGRAVGWVNASLRSTYAKYDGVDPGGPAPDSVAGVSCFVIAPPYRGHGIASALLDRVVADGAARGARHIEGYPRRTAAESEADSFTGRRVMFDARGFHAAAERDHFTLVRRPAETPEQG